MGCGRPEGIFPLVAKTLLLREQSVFSRKSGVIRAILIASSQSVAAPVRIMLFDRYRFGRVGIVRVPLLVPIKGPCETRAIDTSI